MPVINISRLSFEYSKDVKILQDINLRIDEPGFVCIIGPNGVGKSTLVKCISGILKPTSGSIMLNSSNLDSLSPAELAKIIGYVPSRSGDISFMTVLDTVLVGRYAHQKWKTNAEDVMTAHKALEVMESEILAMSFFDELSAGQHQKVSLARGLVQESAILVLDEPTSNLDIRHQVYVMEFLRALCKKTSTTIVMVSHDLNLSAKYADTLVVLEPPGKIYGVGTPAEIITKDMIKQVYKINCDVVDDHGSPHVILQSVIMPE